MSQQLAIIISILAQDPGAISNSTTKNMEVYVHLEGENENWPLIATVVIEHGSFKKTVKTGKNGFASFAMPSALNGVRTIEVADVLDALDPRTENHYTWTEYEARVKATSGPGEPIANTQLQTYRISLPYTGVSCNPSNGCTSFIECRNATVACAPEEPCADQEFRHQRLSGSEFAAGLTLISRLVTSPVTAIQRSPILNLSRFCELN